MFPYDVLRNRVPGLSRSKPSSDESRPDSAGQDRTIAKANGDDSCAVFHSSQTVDNSSALVEQSTNAQDSIPQYRSLMGILRAPSQNDTLKDSPDAVKRDTRICHLANLVGAKTPASKIGSKSSTASIPPVDVKVEESPDHGAQEVDEKAAEYRERCQRTAAAVVELEKAVNQQEDAARHLRDARQKLLAEGLACPDPKHTGAHQPDPSNHRPASRLCKQHAVHPQAEKAPRGGGGSTQKLPGRTRSCDAWDVSSERPQPVQPRPLRIQGRQMGSASPQTAQAQTASSRARSQSPHPQMPETPSPRPHTPPAKKDNAAKPHWRP